MSQSFIIDCIQTIGHSLTDVAESHIELPTKMMDLLTDTTPGASLPLYASLSLLFSYFVHLISGCSSEPPFERKSKTYGKFFA